MAVMKFSLLLLLVAVAVKAKSINLSEKELKSIGLALKNAIDKHTVDGDQHKFTGTFNLIENADDPEDFDTSISIDISDTLNGALSRKSVNLQS